ncbi:MAG: YqaJ viral recombinase family protein [Cutibacterium avidum]|nr:YqaJ viral recombinase family protein [Cutibacterium avidum]
MRRSGTAVALGSWPDGSPAWLEARRGRIGGSDIAAICGLSPWCSPWQLWHRKRGSIDDKPSSDLMEAGHYVEPAAASWYAGHHLPEGLHLRNVGTWVHQDRDWQLANPDRLIVDNPHSERRPVGVLEIKYTPNNPGQWSRDGVEGPPPHYWAQVQWYMDVFGVGWADVAVLSTWGFRCFHVKRDNEWLSLARHEAENFIAMLELGIEPPDDDESPAKLYAVERLRHPGIINEQVTITDPDDLRTIGQAAQLHAAAKDASDEAKACEDSAKAILAQAMGNARTAIAPDGTTLATRRARKGRDGQPGTPFITLN